jgi:alkylation response protein AidB-like acyl-CoA dehydrogenase
MVPRPLAELLAGIAMCSEVLEATTFEAEQCRTAPPDLVDALRWQLRVSLVKAPVEVGGDELSPTEQLSYFERLAYANSTAGWIGFVHAGATGIVGARLPDEGVHRVFAADRIPLCAGIVAPSGKCEPEGRGFVVSGRWRFASGVRHSDFILVAASDPSAGQRSQNLTVPVSEVTIEDDWHVMAQQGTGSVDVVMDNVFVPEEMVLVGREGPQRGGLLYRALRSTAYIAGENGGYALGVARRFLDELMLYAQKKSRGRDGVLVDRGAFLHEYGRADLQVQAARSFMESVLRESWLAAQAKGALSAQEDARLAGALSFVTSSCADAVTRLFPFAGGSALHLSSPLQRAFRDVHGSTQHYLASSIAFERHASSTFEDKADRLH